MSHSRNNIYLRHDLGYKKRMYDRLYSDGHHNTIHKGKDGELLKWHAIKNDDLIVEFEKFYSKGDVLFDGEINKMRYYDCFELEDLYNNIETFPKQGYVYLIGNTEYGFVKIGYSTNPQLRLRSIQTGCPFKVKVLSFFNGTMETESRLQEKYKQYQSYGEWFFIKGELKEAIEQYL